MILAKFLPKSKLLELEKDVIKTSDEMRTLMTALGDNPAYNLARFLHFSELEEMDQKEFK